jgi:hypothetical protein
MQPSSSFSIFFMNRLATGKVNAKSLYLNIAIGGRIEEVGVKLHVFLSRFSSRLDLERA